MSARRKRVISTEEIQFNHNPAVIAIVNVVNVCYCGMLLKRRAPNFMIHVVHLKVNFHRLKISVFDLDRAVCKILNSGSPWVIASHKGWTIHPGRTTNL